MIGHDHIGGIRIDLLKSNHLELDAQDHSAQAYGVHADKDHRFKPVKKAADQYYRAREQGDQYVEKKQGTGPHEKIDYITVISDISIPGSVEQGAFVSSGG